MRILSIFVLLIVALVEVGPVPFTPFLLIWIVLFRPPWFYDWVMKIYHKKDLGQRK